VHSHWLGGRRTSYGAGLPVNKFTGARSPDSELPPFSELLGLAKFWDKVPNILHAHFGVSGGQFTLKADRQRTTLPAVQPSIRLRDLSLGSLEMWGRARWSELALVTKSDDPPRLRVLYHT
jgi:hypothetical protein